MWSVKKRPNDKENEEQCKVFVVHMFDSYFVIVFLFCFGAGNSHTNSIHIDTHTHIKLNAINTKNY